MIRRVPTAQMSGRIVVVCWHSGWPNGEGINADATYWTGAPGRPAPPWLMNRGETDGKEVIGHLHKERTWSGNRPTDRHPMGGSAMSLPMI